MIDQVKVLDGLFAMGVVGWVVMIGLSAAAIWVARRRYGSDSVTSMLITGSAVLIVVALMAIAVSHFLIRESVKKDQVFREGTKQQLQQHR